MSMVGETRAGQGGIVEICTAIGDPGGYERWEPWVDVYVRSQALPIGNGYSDASIYTCLIEAGWIAPARRTTTKGRKR